MNRRHFLALLGSTAVATVLPAIPVLAAATPRGYGLRDLMFPADDANWGYAFSYEDASLQLVQYGMSVIYTDVDHAEHIPIEEFFAPRMFTEKAA